MYSTRLKLACVLIFLATAQAHAEKVLFQDDFAGKLGDGWTWLREEPSAWRVDQDALRIHVQPGNMWGGANDARNVLLRPLPEVKSGALEISVTVENSPTSQYEQVNLVWYYADSHMVKIGLEQVHGQLSLVMGREEADKTGTIALIAVEATKLQLRFTARGDQLRGEYCTGPEAAWQLAGECTLPSNGSAPKASIQCYQGPTNAEHWARITAFKITAVE